MMYQRAVRRVGGRIRLSRPEFIDEIVFLAVPTDTLFGLPPALFVEIIDFFVRWHSVLCR